MKNLHTIATYKPPIKGDLLLRHLWKGEPNECISWWRYNDTRTYGRVVVYTTLNGSFMDSPSSFKVQHIYITNSEEIKVGDYITDGYKVWQWKDDSSLLGRKKIILTTDQDLIKDSVQAIDDEFLEWFVNNPSCEEVEFDYLIDETSGELVPYKIIIPKEEPKYPIGGYAPGYYMCNCSTCKKQFQGDKRAVQCEPCAIEMIKKEPKQELERGITIIHVGKQETIEEAAERYAVNKSSADVFRKAHREDFIRGAQWQQEKMYSEEEVIKFLQQYRYDLSSNKTSNLGDTTKQWFNEFKKK